MFHVKIESVQKCNRNKSKTYLKRLHSKRPKNGFQEGEERHIGLKGKPSVICNPKYFISSTF